MIIAAIAVIKAIFIDEEEKAEQDARKRWKKQADLKEIEDEVRKNI